jgi:hypothetical protein
MEQLGKKNPGAASVLQKTNEAFSKGREFLDDVAGDVRDVKLQKTLDKLSSDKGEYTRGQLKNLLEHVGIDANDLVTDVMTSDAASKSLDIFSDKLVHNMSYRTVNLADRGLNITGLAKGAPAKKLLAKATGASPRYSIPARVNRSLQPGRIDRAKLSSLRATANVSEFVRKLSPQARKQLMDNPQMFRAIRQSAIGAIQLEEQVPQMLMQQVPGGQQP